MRARGPARLGCRAHQAPLAAQRLLRLPGLAPARPGRLVHRAAGWPSGRTLLPPVQAPADSAMTPQRHLQQLHTSLVWLIISCSTLAHLYRVPRECSERSSKVQADLIPKV